MACLNFPETPAQLAGYLSDVKTSCCAAPHAATPTPNHLPKPPDLMPDTNQRSSRPWTRMVARTLRTYGTVCHLCGHQDADTADHLKPLAHGGQTTIDNLRPAHHHPCPTCHQRCNTARGTKPVTQARQQLGAPNGCPTCQSDDCQGASEHW